MRDALAENTPATRTPALRTNRTWQSWWVTSKRTEAGADRTGRRRGRERVRERAFLDETTRARRVVEHMRKRGYPTPVWLAVGVG